MVGRFGQSNTFDLISEDGLGKCILSFYVQGLWYPPVYLFIPRYMSVR